MRIPALLTGVCLASLGSPATAGNAIRQIDIDCKHASYQLLIRFDDRRVELQTPKQRFDISQTPFGASLTGRRQFGRLHYHCRRQGVNIFFETLDASNPVALEAVDVDVEFDAITGLRPSRRAVRELPDQIESFLGDK